MDGKDRADIPKTGYGGTYKPEMGGVGGAAGAGEVNDVAAEAAGTLADADNNAGLNATEQIDDMTTSGSSDIAENTTPPPPDDGRPSSMVSVGGAMVNKDDLIKPPAGPMSFRDRMAAGMARFGRGGKHKRGPMAVILGLVAVVSILMFGSSAMLPFHFQELLMDQFNPVHSGFSQRSNRIMAQSFNQTPTEVAAQRRISGMFEQRNGFSANRIQQFNQRGSRHGVAFRPNPDGRGHVLSFDNGTTTRTVRTQAEFDALFNSDPNFRHGMGQTTRTWTGPNAPWFDRTMLKVLKRFNLQERNVFRGFVQNVENAESGNAAFRNTLQEVGDGTVNPGGVRTTQVEVRTEDADGNVTITMEDATGSNVSLRRGRGDEAALAQAREILQSTTLKTAMGVAVGANILCPLMVGLMSAVRLTQAEEFNTVMAFAKVNMEPVDRAKVADNSPVNELGALLTSTSQSEDGTVRSGTEGSMFMNVAVGSPVNPNDPYVERFNPTNLMAGWFSSLVNSGVGQAMGEVVTFRNCMVLAGATAVVTAGIAIGSVVVGGLTGGVGLVASFVGQITQTAIRRAALVAGVSVAAGIAMNWIAERMVTNLAIDARGPEATSAIVAGVQGVSNYNAIGGGLGIGGRDAALTYHREQREAMAFNAELRRGERSPWDVTTTDTFMGSILSRFGLMAPSSRTAGTLLTGLGGMAGRSVASLLPTRMAHAADDAAFLENIGDCPRLEEIGAVGNRICQPFVVSDSSTTPIDAYDLYRIMAWMHGEPDPENLSCRNAAGYGAPNFLCRMAEASEEEFLYVTERRTEPVTGAEFYDTRAFRADDGKYYITELIPDRAGGLEQIGRGSRLGDYVTFCSNRSTFWGEVDNNILAMQGGTGRRVLSTTGVALNWVPVVSDITSLASSAQDLALLDAGWATGQNCVVGDGTFTTAEGTTRDFHGTGTLGWSRETRFLSQYLEDQRIFEGAGMISSSPSIAFIEEHDPWGWANDSYESFLAMISGLTPTEVAATMDMIDWVARMMDPDYVAALGPFTRDVRSASEQLPEVEDWREEVSRSVQEAATKIGSAFHWAAKRQWGTT